VARHRDRWDRFPLRPAVSRSAVDEANGPVFVPTPTTHSDGLYGAANSLSGFSARSKIISANPDRRATLSLYILKHGSTKGHCSTRMGLAATQASRQGIAGHGRRCGMFGGTPCPVRCRTWAVVSASRGQPETIS